MKGAKLLSQGTEDVVLDSKTVEQSVLPLPSKGPSSVAVENHRRDLFMECSYCGKTESKVVDSRPAKDAITIRRRRKSLACSGRFTTYESTEEQPLPFLIVRNIGQGSTIPDLRTTLSIISSTLTVLSGETEKLIEKVDKAEKSQPAKESKGKAASKKKVSTKEKTTSWTSTRKVVKIIKGHIHGAEEDIFEEGLALNEAVKDYEKRLILEALEKTNWVKAKAARLLHINRTTLLEKIKKQNLTQTGSLI